MKIITEGHRYLADCFENKAEGVLIQFIEKRVDAENELITVNDGTTNEELLRILLDRMSYLQSKFPCRENAIVITKLDEALLWLEKRTRDRVERGVEGKHLK